MKILRAGNKSLKVTIKRPKSPKSKHGYTDRNKNLLALGFRSYSEYLHSDMWRLIRDLAFETNGRRCVSCSKPATQIHHSSYDMRTLVGSLLTELHPVCAGCHKAAEIKGEDKAHKKDANAALGVTGLPPQAEKRGRYRAGRFKVQKPWQNVPVKTRKRIRHRAKFATPKECVRDLALAFGLPIDVVRDILDLKHA